jgi:hypothetical protein
MLTVACDALAEPLMVNRELWAFGVPVVARITRTSNEVDPLELQPFGHGNSVLMSPEPSDNVYEPLLVVVIDFTVTGLPAFALSSKRSSRIVVVRLEAPVLVHVIGKLLPVLNVWPLVGDWTLTVTG